MSDARVSKQRILEAVAKFYDVTVDALTERSQSKRVTQPRQLAMYLMRKHTEATYVEIGLVLDRTHATVLAGERAIERALRSNAKLQRDLLQLVEQIHTGEDCCADIRAEVPELKARVERLEKTVSRRVRV